MPAILQLSKVQFNANNGTLNVSQDEINIASIPSLVFWFSAKKSMKRAGSIKDRIGGLVVTPTSASDAESILKESSFSNGVDALLAPDTAIRPYDLSTPLNFKATSFSVAMVVKRSATDAGIGRILGHNGAIGAEDYTPTMGFGAPGGQFTLWRGGDLQRIQSRDVDFSSKQNLIILTFHNTGGLKLYINGDLNNTNPNDRVALTKTTFRFFQIGAATIASDAGFAGLIGDIMIFNDDLSLSQNSFYLDMLTNYLVSKYGIG